MSDKLYRQERVSEQMNLFDLEPTWKDSWWSMPEFSMRDVRPKYRITVNLMTKHDLHEFSKATGVRVTERTNSMWYPNIEKMKHGSFYYDGPKTDSKYPVCIPSKGRADCQRTGKALDRMGVSYKFFVEQHEYETYCQHLGENKVVKMPFSNLGQGSIPARNFIWEWAKERGHERHWTVDDNINRFVRCNMNRRIGVKGGGFFRAMEDFVDRYENIAMAGPHNVGFVPDRSPTLTPFLMNSRVYSCILLNTKLDYRWRGKYNEDTDLSLRLLKDGYCTLLFRALCMDKMPTVGVKNGKAMKGGNTDNVYNTGDKRLSFAKSLQDQHPDVVEIVWKFNRWHHRVDYRPFKNNKPILKPNIVREVGNNEYCMELKEKQ
jgi:hypothetical protein